MTARVRSEACTVANGQCCPGLGSVTIPIALRDRVKLINALVIPSLPHTLILGADFGKKMEIVPDLRHGEWSFVASSTIQLTTIALTS